MEAKRGHWAPRGDGGLRVWTGGASSWSDPHGPATVHYLFGKPVRVEGARLPDGTAIPSADTYSHFEPDVWRRPDGNGGFLLGRMLIREDGAFLTDDPALEAAFKADPAADGAIPFQRDVARDPEFMRRIQGDAFAEAVYATFCNREWRRSDGERHTISWRRSGEMVADLRRRGESYNDFYPYANAYDRDSREVADAEEIYARLGWTELTDAERTDDHALAVSFLETVERRPAGERKPEERFGPKNMDERTDLYARAWRANRDGRATDDELEFIADRLIPERREMTPEEFAASECLDGDRPGIGVV